MRGVGIWIYFPIHTVKNLFINYLILSSSGKLFVGIVNFKFKDYNSAVEDLSSCVKRDKKNSSAHTYLVSSNIYGIEVSFFLVKDFLESWLPKNIQKTVITAGPCVGIFGSLGLSFKFKF